MNDAKEEIRERLPVEDVVGQYVELKRAGRTLKGRSPWGVDKTPSFMVSPEKGIWHDFSANKGGDIFTFIMEVEGISFREALEKLAAQAGVELKKYSRSDIDLSKKKARAREALELACKYYQFCLSKNQNVCKYVFYKRNLNRNTVKEFRIGYSPKTGKALLDFLKKRGFTIEELNNAGLLNRFSGDLFRGRMMVPFIDTGGDVIGFTARVLEKSEPKYLNTPETILFNKSRFIFGLSSAKEAIRHSGFCVIVEGNMDVISSHQAGVKETVATSGTAMTTQHLKILSRLTDDIRLAYDGDSAGIKATERAIMMAGDLGISLSVISDYQGAKDPDELIQRGPELWQAAVESKRPAVEWLLDRYEEQFDLTTGDGKRKYSDLALKVVNYLKDPIEKKHYEQLIARRLDVSLDDLFAKKLESPKKKRLKPVKNAKINPILGTLEDNLLAIFLYSKMPLELDLEPPKDTAKLAELELIFTERYKKWEQETLKKEFQALKERYKDELRKQELENLKVELEKNESDEEKMKEILRKITTLQRENH